MKCPRCNRRLREQGKKCVHCGWKKVRVVVLGNPERMCPKGLAAGKTVESLEEKTRGLDSRFLVAGMRMWMRGF